MAARSLSSSTYDELLRRLLGGQLRPGQTFNRRALAGELRVSVAPLLEALVMLECEGLIITTPRKGTRVRSLTEPDLRGLLVVREALECQAARLACGPPMVKHAERLLKLAAQLDARPAKTADDARAVARFHHHLVALAAVPALTDAYERIMKLHLLYVADDPAAALPPRHGSYVQLVRSLQHADPDRAESAMRSLLQSEAPAKSKDKESPISLETPPWLKD